MKAANQNNNVGTNSYKAKEFTVQMNNEQPSPFSAPKPLEAQPIDVVTTVEPGNYGINSSFMDTSADAISSNAGFSNNNAK